MDIEHLRDIIGKAEKHLTFARDEATLMRKKLDELIEHERPLTPLEIESFVTYANAAKEIANYAVFNVKCFLLEVEK